MALLWATMMQAADSFVPVRIELAAPNARARLDRYQESVESVSFIIEADAKLRATVAPRRFAIEAGREYSVNSSMFEPFLLRAERNGELAFDLDRPRNCTVLIEPSKGGNLLPNPSFEETTDANAATGWEGKSDLNQRATLEYGHESLGDGGASPAKNAVANVETAVTDQKRRTGRRSFRLTKTTTTGNAELLLPQPVSVASGAEYLLSGWYNLDGLQFGGAMHIVASVTSAGKPPLYFRDVMMNPLIFTGSNQWQRAFFRFTVPADYADARVAVSVSLRGAPFTAYWDDLELRPAPTKVTQWPRSLNEETLRPRHSPEEVRERMRERPSVAVKVVNDRGQPRVMVDGQPLPLFGFNAGPSGWPGGAAHADFRDAGVRVHWIPLWLAQTGARKQYGEPIWLDDGTYDFSFVEKRLETILGYDPDARVLFYLFVQPYPEFGDKHPEAVWRNARGGKTIGTKSNAHEAEQRGPVKTGIDEAWNISYTATAFRREGADVLKQLGRHLASSNLGKAVVGVHLLCGADGQWFCQAGADHLDRSPGNMEAFREWLRRRYGNDLPSFRRAWDDERLTFDTAALPEEAERSPEKFFLDPNVGADRRVIDANRFSSEGVAETINLFARSFKEGIRRPCLVTTYYHDILHNHQMNHWALGLLLGSSELDGVVSVMEYGLKRALGRTGCFSSLVASLRLHNKIYLTEMDYRTNNSWLPGDALDFRKNWGVPPDAASWANQIRRDLGMSLAQGEGGWIYGLGGNGWVEDSYLAGVAEANKAAERAAQTPWGDDRGQIAVFCDEQIEDYATRRNIFGASLAMTGHNIAREALTRSGLTWDAYLLSDLDHPKRHDYRLNLFLSSPTITPRQVEWVKRHLQKDGRVLVFVNAAGYALGNRFEENIRELTGMTVRCDLTRPDVYRFTRASGNDPLADGIENLMTESAGPMFYVDDPEATPLAMLSGSDKVGLAVKRFKDWTSVYVALPGGFTPRFLRNLAREANLTPTGPEGDATYAGNGFLVLHALAPGEKTLTWTEPGDLFDLSNGVTVATNAVSYSFPMDALETRWFRRVRADR